jgi:hypothetical protein
LATGTVVSVVAFGAVSQLIPATIVTINKMGEMVVLIIVMFVVIC